MKNLILSLAILLFTSMAWGRMGAVSLGTGQAPSSVVTFSCTGALYCQKWEGTGADNGETWTGGDQDYSTSPLEGSQSMRANNVAVYSPFFTSSGTVYAHDTFYLESTNSGGAIAYFVQTGGGNAGQILTTSGAHMSATHGSVTVTGTFTFSANTKYHMWRDYSVGTGSNGTYRVYFSTTATKPATPDIEITNGTGTGNVNRSILWGNQNIVRWDENILRTSSF